MQPQTSRWRGPHSWITFSAIGLVLLGVVVAIGFVRGYIMLGSIFLDQYFAGESLSPYTLSTIHTIFASAIVPVTVSMAGATLLFARKKIGIYISLAAIGTYFVMDAVHIIVLRDGHHVIQSYTGATWLIRAFNEYGGYILSIYVFYFLYVPALVGMAASLLIGKKKQSFADYKTAERIPD